MSRPRQQPPALILFVDFAKTSPSGFLHLSPARLLIATLYLKKRSNGTEPGSVLGSVCVEPTRLLLRKISVDVGIPICILASFERNHSQLDVTCSLLCFAFLEPKQAANRDYRRINLDIYTSCTTS